VSTYIHKGVLWVVGVRSFSSVNYCYNKHD
jgi:hypothetical protein